MNGRFSINICIIFSKLLKCFILFTLIWGISYFIG